jgi:uncharacterized protein YkwD
MIKDNTPTISTPGRRALFGAAAIGSAFILASCGGGGGGGSTASPTPTPTATVDVGVAGSLIATGFPDPFTTPPTQRPRAVVGDTLVQVSFTASNSGPQTASGALFTLPAVSGFTATTITCGSASGGAACPSGLTLQAAAGGVAVTLPAGGAMTFTVAGTVTQAGSIAPRATIAAPAGQTDTATGNNTAQMAIAVEAPAASTLVTSVPPATYTAGSDLREAYDWLSGVRHRCGFGLLRQDTRLDQASAAHSNYMVLNNYVSHTEEVGKAGFTGVTAADRAVSAGYPNPWSAGDEIATSFANTTTTVLSSVQGLVSGAYHMVGMLGGDRDMGIGYAAGVFSATTITLASVTQSDLQQLEGAGVTTYPCNGEVISRRVHGPETPSPLPGVDLTTVGPALLAAVRWPQMLTVSEWTISPQGGSPLSATVLTKSTDPNGRLTIDVAVLIPNSVLAPNTTYNAVLKGTNAGVPFTKTYSFSTGS